MKPYSIPPLFARRILPLLTILLMLWQAQPVEGKAHSIALSSAGRLDAASPQASLALAAARGMGMDWVILEIDWNALPSPRTGVYNLDALAETIREAERLGLNVALSLHHAPAWAMDAAGPNPQAAAEIVRQVVALAPGGIRAVELFPEPNTASGWGAEPNPAAYAVLLRSVRAALQEDARTVMLVTGGLAPVLSGDSGAVSDLDFLQALYTAGAAPDVDAVGISYPVFDPARDDPEDPQGLLRHYQDVRLLMLRNGHKTAQLWITRLAWETAAPEAIQNQWLSAAYQLIQQQVYISLVAFDGLTPPPKRPLTVVDQTGHLTTQFDLVGDAIAGTPLPKTWSTLLHQLIKGAFHKQPLNKNR